LPPAEYTVEGVFVFGVMCARTGARLDGLEMKKAEPGFCPSSALKDSV
jgi:hypothetical protein